MSRAARSGHSTGGRRMLAAGVAIAAVYLTGSALSGHLSPLARRPLLDGLASPPPYRWVKPPPDLAATNAPAESGSVTLKLAPDGSVAGVVSTGDFQVTVIFSNGAYDGADGATGVKVTVEPLDPATLSAPPGGLVVTGNAYRVTASYVGGGPSAGPPSSLGAKADVQMVYPALSSAGVLPAEHVILASPDGDAWTQLRSTDSPASQAAAAKVSMLGYFEVAAPKGATSAPKRAGRSYLPFIIAGVGVLLLVLSSPSILARLRRRGRREERSWR